jgi:serine protease Do
MSKRMRLFILCITFLTVLACGAPNTLPPATPTAVKPVKSTATPVEEPEIEATPVSEETPETPTLTGDDRQIRQNLLRATVQIFALVNEGGQYQPLWTGSGSILTPDGLILTNAHVASDPDPNYQPDALGVAITVRSDDTPELRYLAEIRAIDYDLDLAVIQIVSDLSGNSVDPEQLGLTYVELGDSDALELGDFLHILGYPSIGGETITFTEGVVSGFTREPGIEGRAYVKTDATIAGGNSGGLAANLSGEIIGVPTQVGYGGAERFADCRYLADTNGDGYINENDNCIPVGGFINAIRPVNLAKSLVAAVQSGAAVPTTPTPTRPKPGKTSGQASFSNLVFAPAVDEYDQPTQVVTQLPTGMTELYACWEYERMVDGATWEARWYLDGVYQEDVSWTPAPWKGGESGRWWVSVSNENGLIEGIYRLELYVDDEKLAEGSIKVGGAASPSTTPGEGLLIRGTVINANTKRGIEGALYIVLNPGVTVGDWEGEEDQVYTFAQTDLNGYFELPYALDRGQSYGILVWAEGYRPVIGDDVFIGDEESPYEVEVALQRE